MTLCSALSFGSVFCKLSRAEPPAPPVSCICRAGETIVICGYWEPNDRCRSCYHPTPFRWYLFDFLAV